ncbi:capsular biosynthesis protein [Pseudomonas indica]|uniref:capsular polysaccharide export protein, LipB/KpsS family n=1 Tax=Pseudomonas indica TaxID=137658 RepID=UPI0023F9A457|nr:capsular biosynthesis protein [Pseudomonas indica]MBU3056368.1 capsular biosynthesis protein [Pseudomonas indica]
MTTFLFFSLAKHQTIYFRRLLNETDLRGKVVGPLQWPLPRPWQWSRVAGRIDWPAVIAEKCQERLVKRKYAGRLYRLLVRLELGVMALRAVALLDREKPDAVVMWNGSHRYCQVLRAVLPAGTRTFFFENGLLPDTTTLDPRGVNYFNSVPRDAEFFLNYRSPSGQPGDVQAVQLVPRKPRQTGLPEIELPERFIFIPFQDDRDTQVRLFSPWIKSMRELFAVGERLAQASGIPVVFKEHPSSRESYPDLHERAGKGVLFANGNSTQALIEASQYVVTLNSTVGLESLLLGKPVMTLGQAFFNIEGLVAHADSLEEVLQLAKDFPNWSLDERVRQHFFQYMAEEYCIPGSWRNADQTHLRKVAQRMLASS